MKDYAGRTIINGQLKYASVSSVKLFDVRTRGGCPRRWFKRYVEHQREPETDNMIEAKAAGLELDAQVKEYWRTGSKAMSALAIKGLHILEAPGPDLKLDKAIHAVSYFRNGQPFAPLPQLPNGDHPDYPKDVEIVVRSVLTAGGVPFVGELDMAHERGHYRDDDGEYHQDPPKTIEVCDLKYKSNATTRDGDSTFLRETDLVRDIQMAGYGEWVGRVRPDIQHVRLSHLYFPKKPASSLPTKVTRLHVLDDCRRTWEYVESAVRSMVDVARETDIERVPGADKSMSCDAYSGCPYRETCSAYKRNSLDNIYGKIADDHIQEKNMGLIAQTQPQLMQNAAPQQTAPSQQQLAAEEQAMRASTAQQQQQMPQQLNLQEYLLAGHRLSQYGFGMPALAGNAAQAYAAAAGQSVAPGFVYPSAMAPAGAAHSLHTLTLTEPGQVFQLERECAAKVNPQPQPPITAWQTAPQQAPASPPMSFAPQQIAAPQQAAPQVAAAASNFLSPGAPESMPQLAQAAALPPVRGPNDSEPPEPTKKRGRPGKKSQDAASEPVAAGSPIAAQAVPPSPAASAPQVGDTGAASAYSTADASEYVATACILVNARSESFPTKSLAGYVDYINETLAKRYNVRDDGTPGPLDCRTAVEGSILGFGGWKGAVRTVVQADPPPPGAYHFDTFMNELNELVADSLRVVAEKCGWLYVRGTR